MTAEDTKSHPPRQFARRWGPYSGALRVLTLIAIGTVLYLARAAFVPIVLAVLFSLLLTTPVEALRRRGMPRAVATILILVIFVALIGEAVNLLWTPAQAWWGSAPKTIQTIERKIRPVSRAIVRLESLTSRATQITVPSPPRSSGTAGATRAILTPAVVTPSASPALAILHGTGSVVIDIVTVIILSMFLLTGGPPMIARMSAALASDLQMMHMLRVIDAVRHEVGRYYATIALINLGLGLATAGMTRALGMPNPLLWGAVAAIFNFVPYIGSATTLLLLSVVAFVSFDTAGRVAAVAGSYVLLATIEGQIVQPLLVGRRLELNPIMVFLALWFGGWFWGIGGIVIAVPTLVVLKVVAEHSRDNKPLQEFLSPNELHRYHPKQVTAILGSARERPRGTQAREAGKP